MTTVEETEERYRELMSHLGSELNLGEILSDDGNLGTVGYDENKAVEFDLDETGWIVLSTIVGNISNDLIDDWSTLLLVGNAFWIGTGGGTLGLDPETGSVILCYREPVLMIESEGIVNLYENFTRAAIAWSDRLLQPSGSEDDQPSGDMAQILSQGA